jgi:hypothetical protein
MVPLLASLAAHPWPRLRAKAASIAADSTTSFVFTDNCFRYSDKFLSDFWPPGPPEVPAKAVLLLYSTFLEHVCREDVSRKNLPSIRSDNRQPKRKIGSRDSVKWRRFLTAAQTR